MAIILMLSSILFYGFEHPLAMSLGLIIQATLISVVTARLAANPWYSYILFMIFVGALLVLFIYVATLAANDIFVQPKRWAPILAGCGGLMCIFGLLWAWSTSHYFKGPCSNNWEFFSVFCFSPAEQASSGVKVFVWKPVSKTFTILVMWFLLLALLVAASMTRESLGPVRPSVGGKGVAKSPSPRRWPGSRPSWR